MSYFLLLGRVSVLEYRQKGEGKGMAKMDSPSGSDQSVLQLQDRNILILYGTETGTSQETAEHLGRMCERLHFCTCVEEMDGVKLVRLLPGEVKSPLGAAHGMLFFACRGQVYFTLPNFLCGRMTYSITMCW